MKCTTCGYEHVYTDDGLKGEPFIKIKGVDFRVDTTMRWGEQSERVYLYACPECGTVRMENL